MTGAVHDAYKEWIDSLGDALTLRQKACAAQILALASMLDAAPGEPLSSKAAASRALSAAASELRDAGAVGMPKEEGSDGPPPPGPPPDGVADIAEAARRRRERPA